MNKYLFLYFCKPKYDSNQIPYFSKLCRNPGVYISVLPSICLFLSVNLYIHICLPVLLSVHLFLSFNRVIPAYLSLLWICGLSRSALSVRNNEKIGFKTIEIFHSHQVELKMFSAQSAD